MSHEKPIPDPLTGDPLAGIPAASLGRLAAAPEGADDGVSRARLPGGLTVAYQSLGELEHFHSDIFEKEIYLSRDLTLPEEPTVLDVGGNIGLFTLFVASRFPKARIFTFEPAPPLFRRLAENAARHAPRARLFNAGVSSRPGSAELTFYPASSGLSSFHADEAEEREILASVLAREAEHGVEGARALAEHMDDYLAERLRAETFTCPMLTLADVIERHGIERIDLLKLDVQKAEADVLAGLGEAGWARLRQMVVEVHDLEGRLDRVIRELEQRGFSVHVEQDDLYTETNISNLYAVRKESAARPARKASGEVSGGGSGARAGQREQLMSFDESNDHEELAPTSVPEAPAPTSAPEAQAPEAQVPEAQAEGFAIVGMAGRFPGAQDLDQFWRNLAGGVESIRRFTREELAAAGVEEELLDSPRYVKASGHLAGADRFDAPFFGFGKREAEIMDPQHRLFLEAAWEALENAGHDPARFGGAIGIFGGMGPSSYLLYNLAPNREIYRELGGLTLRIHTDKDFLASMAAYKLGLTGPAMSVQTACSTSLVAVSLACQSLLTYQCDMALAGGVSVGSPLEAGYIAQQDVLDPGGHCRAFDAAASGTVSGHGVGMVVLRRLEDALADGDHIYGVVRGFAVNNDGALKVGYTAPSVEGQAEVVAMAQAMAGVDPTTIGYVEAHGTATPLGDPIEVEALNRAFADSGAEPGSCLLGSVKTNIGHLDAAAGVASLIKTVLALGRGRIPPSLNFERPNPNIAWERGPFRVASELSPWPDKGGAPRRAGVSSFAVGGVNAHVVVEEAPATASSSEASPSEADRRSHLLFLSARTPEALEAATDRLADHLEDHPEISLADAAYTTQVGRKAFEHRRAFVAKDPRPAIGALRRRDPRSLFEGAAEDRRRPVAFVFPGLGDQYPGMARDLYRTEPVFAAVVDEAVEHLRPRLVELTGADLRELLLGGADSWNEKGGDEEGAPSAKGPDLRAMLGRSGAGSGSGDGEGGDPLRRTLLAHTSLFVVEVALAALWRSWGVEPQAVAGYSLGEYAAAHTAGIFSLPTALDLVLERARLVETLPKGAMLAVPLAPEALEGRLARAARGEVLAVAAVNGPELSVVAGAPEAVERLADDLGAEGTPCRRLSADHPFHSPLLAPVADAWRAVVSKAPSSPPEIPLLSNVTGGWLPPGVPLPDDYWVDHLLRPVRFSEILSGLWAEPGRVLLELGPGQSLGSLALQHPAASQAEAPLVLGSLPGPYDGQTADAFVADTLARAWTAGLEIDWAAYHLGPAEGPRRDVRRRRVALPTYPFQRRRYWLDPPEWVAGAGKGVPAPASGASETVAAGGVQAAAASGGAPGGEPAAASPGSSGGIELITPGAGSDAAKGGRRPFVAPSNPVEETIAGIWKSVLGTEKVGVHDNFFQIGGHSLQAVQVLSRMRESFGREFPLSQLFATPTIAGLAEGIEGAQPARPAPGFAAPVPDRADEVPGTSTSPAPEAADETAPTSSHASSRAGSDGVPGTSTSPSPKVAAGVPGASSGTSAAPDLGEIPRPDALPLSFAQHRLWLLDQMGLAGPAYNLPSAVVLGGKESSPPLDVGALRASLDEITRRHESLRTRFRARGEEAEQIIDPPAPLPLPWVDLSGLELEAGREEAARLARREAVRLFDTAAGPLLRAALLHQSPTEHVLLVNMHHLVSDGWSMGIFTRELSTLYPYYLAGGEEAGTPYPLPEPPVGYPDYALWQRARFDEAGLAGELAHWEEALADLPILELPTDRPRRESSRHPGGLVPLAVTPETAAALGRHAQSRRSTPFMVLAAAYQVLLYRFSGQTDFGVGVPLASRLHKKVEPLIGFFINTVVLRADLSGEPSFEELMLRVRRTSLDAFAHQDLPFERVVEALAPPRPPGGHPLFQAAFSLQNTPETVPDLAGVGAEILPAILPGAKFDLTAALFPKDDGRMAGNLEYDRDLFDRATVERFAACFERILAAVAEDPAVPVSRLGRLAPAEEAQLWAEWNDVEWTESPADARPWGPGSPIHARVLSRAAEHPDARAVSMGDEHWTYGGLAARSGALARELIHHGVGADKPVGLLVERSPEWILAMLAVLRAGGCFLPLDPSSSPERLARIVDEALAPAAETGDSPVILGRPELSGSLPPSLGSSLTFLDVGAPRFPEEGGGTGSEAPSAEAPSAEVHPEQLAYILYTSGSTGAPKGVAIPHRGLANLVSWATEAHPVGAHPTGPNSGNEGGRSTQMAALTFDAAQWEVWPCLAEGATLLLAGEAERLSPEALAAWWQRAAVTRAWVPTGMLEPVLAELPRQLPGESGRLRELTFGGEALRRLPAGPPDLPLADVYGPTEVSVISVTARYEAPRYGEGSAAEAAAEARESSLPGRPAIGKPISGLEALILDPAGRPAVAGAAGELALGGLGLGRGYYHRPGRTAAAWTPHPFRSGERLYRTGDRARLRPDGQLEYLGRLDQQVKVRGFRIELGEIETLLAEHPGVAEAAVLAHGSGAEQLLAAFLVLDLAPGEAFAPGDLHRFLQERLPPYMLPTRWGSVDALPRTAAGKVDRRALAGRVEAETTEITAEYVAPRSYLEETLADIWQEVLRVPRVGVHDDFFLLGGNSLSATQVASQVRAEMQIDLPVATLFEAPTIAELAVELVGALAKQVGGDALTDALADLEEVE